MAIDRKRKIQIVGLLRGDDKVAVLRSAFAAVEGAEVEFRRQTLAEAAPPLVNGHRPDVLFLELGLDDKSELAALTAFSGQSAGRTKVLATATGATPEHVNRMLRAGVAKFIPQPLRRSDI